MSTASETPVLDALAAMTVDSTERCGLAPDMLLLTRIAALEPPRTPRRSPTHARAGPGDLKRSDDMRGFVVLPKR